MSTPTIGGFLAIRNSIALDYCVKEAIESLLPICDQICVSESESSDGTREMLDEWAAREPKLQIIDFQWPDPKGDNKFYPGWINAAREGLTTDYAVTLDADEVLDSSSHERIRLAAQRGESLICTRLNYWRDAQSLIPKGHCCGAEVIRCGPQRLFFPSDYPDDRALEIQCKAIPAPDVIFHHYGFLRQREAFFRKARSVSRIWNGADNFDPRLVKAEGDGGNWMANQCVSEWIHKLTPYTGTHPQGIHQWLRERGCWLTKEDLVAKWQHVLDQGKHVFTWTEPETLAYLCEQASKATHAVEIGTYMGASAFVMLKANPKLHLWCVDPFMVAGTQKVTEHHLAKEIAEGRCELMPRTARESAPQLEHMRGKLNFVFSDDGHLYQNVIDDVESFYPLIREGGVILGHDLDRNPDNEVTKAVKHLFPDFTEPMPRLWEHRKP